MEAKHTPPPWVVIERAMLFEIEGDTGFPVAEVEKVFTKEDAIEVIANVKLIKSAPNLLVALIDILDAFERHTSGFTKGYEYNNLICEQAKIAITDATDWF